MNRLAALALAPLLCAAPAAAQRADTSLVSLVEAERAFSALSGRSGVREAFLANLADDGILFRPGPVNGREFWAGRPSPPVVLTWRPVAAGISAAGDLGFTTGPYEARQPGPEGRTGHGHYVTVWRRGPDGRWKFVVDLGTPNPPPARRLPDWSPPHADGGRAGRAGGDAEAARASLLGAERRLAEASAARGSTDALLDRAAEGVRVHRDGAEPAVGKEAARALLAARPAPTGWAVLRADVSRSGDLGYAYGSYTSGTPTDAGAGHYVRIWRREADGEWRVVLDVTNPPPPPREE